MEFDYDYGLSDPCAACIYPDAAAKEFTGKPVVIIDRPEMEARGAFERMMATRGMQLDPAKWKTMTDNYWNFMAQMMLVNDDRLLVVPYSVLDDSREVFKIGKHVGLTISGNTIDRLQFMHIEQSDKCLQFLQQE